MTLLQHVQLVLLGEGKGAPVAAPEPDIPDDLLRLADMAETLPNG